TGISPAAARCFALAGPPIEVPREVLSAFGSFAFTVEAAPPSALRTCGAFLSAGGALTASSACRAISAAQSEIGPGSGVPSRLGCADSSKPAGLGDLFLGIGHLGWL